MPRLFVAIDLPLALTAALQRLQPQTRPGLRLIPAEQMHLTLHFIGQAALAATADALQTVKARAFNLRLSGLGQFRARAGVTLWAGVEPNAALQELHDAVALALAAGASDAGDTFVQLDARPDRPPYLPHITLARCKPGLPMQVVTRFLDQAGALSLREFTVSDFALYSSITGYAGPQYCCEQRFELAR